MGKGGLGEYCMDFTMSLSFAEVCEIELLIRTLVNQWVGRFIVQSDSFVLDCRQTLVAGS